MLQCHAKEAKLKIKIVSFSHIYSFMRMIVKNEVKEPFKTKISTKTISHLSYSFSNLCTKCDGNQNLSSQLEPPREHGEEDKESCWATDGTDSSTQNGEKYREDRPPNISHLMFETPRYRSMTETFIQKFSNHFERNPHQESYKFMKSFENILNHHVQRTLKYTKMVISEEEIDQYFLYLARLLIQAKIIRGDLFTFWVMNSWMGSYSQIRDSTFVDLDIEKSKSFISLDGHKSVVNLKNYVLKDDINLYVLLSKTLLRVMGNQKFFYDSESESRSAENYLKSISSLLRNYYNSSKITQSLKELKRKDGNLKFLLMGLLEMRGVFEYLPSGKIKLNYFQCIGFRDELNDKSKESEVQKAFRSSIADISLNSELD